MGFLDEVTAQYRFHGQNVSKDQVEMQRVVVKIMDSICERFPDIPEGVGASHVAAARSRALGVAAAALEAQGNRREARKYWWEAFKTRGDVSALLALTGMRETQRKKVARLLDDWPWLSRRVTWYAQKASMMLVADSKRRGRAK